MIGYSRITVDADVLRVRFERVGPGTKFDTILDAFRENFPFATWDNVRRAWSLPASYLPQVQQFCLALFGSTNVKIQYHHTTNRAFCQLTLL